MIERWLRAVVAWLRALFGLPPRRPQRVLHPPLGPAPALHANSVAHGDQHGERVLARPPGPPPPPSARPETRLP